jgi:uracil phosphoribosyltransferase
MFILTQQQTVANHFLAELRDKTLQQDRAKFRRNLERLGEILAYEISKSLVFQPVKVHTPLGVSETTLLLRQPVLVCVMRAGLPFYQGFLSIFDMAESAFIGAFRSKPNTEHEFEIEMHYSAFPDIQGKPLILIDPMLATGKSVVSSYRTLLNHGLPSELHVAAVIASRDGINHLKTMIPDAKLWLGDIDEELNHKFYIIPGLGDAGDLAFGEKI